MGNSSSSDKHFLDNWIHVEKQGSPGTFTNVWMQKKGNKKIEMIEYPLHVSSEEEIKEEKEIFQQRHNHPQLVSSLYFLDESEQEFCSSSYQGKIFIERIPLTLQTVTDIPFPDALNVYSQSLQGFHVLASSIVKNCFPISEENIGINSESICKVWMNSSVEKNYPNTDMRIHEHAMVRMILQTIEENVDHSSLQGRPSPFDYIYTQSRSPSQVRFDEAINLFRNYVKEYFNNMIPESLACVDKVGGVFTLAKSWKSKYNDAQSAMRSQKNFRSTHQLPVLSNSSSIPANETLMYKTSETPQYENNYTAFRREEPILRQTVQAPVVNQEVNYQRMQTPSFSQSINQTPKFTEVTPQPSLVGNNIQGSRVILNQEANRVIPQVVYQDTNRQRFSQVVPSQQLQGSLVNQIPVNRSPATIVNNLPLGRSEVRESIIQNRVINTQINQQQPVIIQQKIPQLNFVQQQSVAQPVIVQQPQPQIIRQQIPVPVQIPIPVKTSQISQAPPNPPVQQVPQVQQTVRKSIITFQTQSQAVSVPQQVPQQVSQQVTSTPYQATKTTSVYITPQMLTNIQALERPESSTGVVNQTFQQTPVSTPTTLPTPAFPPAEQNMRLRNNEQSISSITAKTNPAMQSNEQISDKFYSMKEEQIDNSTRNFYTNMLNNDTTANNDNNFSSYYANYTSKLYDNANEGVEQLETVNSGYLTSTTGYKASLGTEKTETKYKVDLNDGMSSTAFLNELKTMNFSSSNFKKGDTNFDYGLTSYEPLSTVGKYTTNNFNTDTYKYDTETYSATLTDGKRQENDLYVVGQKIQISPLEGNSERLSYEYEQGQNPNGNIRYESELVKIDGENGSYEEQYYENTQYQSTFQKYAAYDQYAHQENQYQQSGLGQNIHTQYSMVNEEAHYHASSPLHQMSEEEYQVDYDPEILADLQKLKGTN